MLLREYQEQSVSEVSRMLAKGVKRACFQLATGGGKTVTFAAICNRFISRSKKSVLIVVHREELLYQTRRTLHEWYGLIGEVVGKKMSRANVYVSMVETLNNKLKKEPSVFADVGLIIIDECHIGNFVKIIEHFNDTYIIGFTATPLSASKKRPLKNYFHDIVCGIDTSQLIEQKALVNNVTYHVKGSVDRSKLKVKNGEFDDAQMGAEFTKIQNVQNTIKGYEDHSIGLKTIVFNCNIEHSIKVSEAFVAAAYNSRHLDSKCSDEYRKQTLNWLKETPDAILHNVGILTTGFDDPSIRTIIVNKSTLSLPLWLQMCGRGARPFPGKLRFNIIDLGANAVSLGDWNLQRNWREIFFNPGEPGNGIAPTKNCPECDAINHAAARKCKGILPTEQECPYIFPEKPIVELPAEFEVFTQNIDVEKIIEENAHRKEYYPFFKIGSDLAKAAKYEIKTLNDTLAFEILERYYGKAKEWCKAKDRKFNQWHRDKAKETLFTELKKHYKKWEIPL